MRAKRFHEDVRRTSAVDALTAIRSAAEILRDTRDLSPTERRRFAEIVLAGEAALERLSLHRF